MSLCCSCFSVNRKCFVSLYHPESNILAVATVSSRIRVILDEGGQMGGSKVNFQKASCTLDASVKIYSHRYTATFMVIVVIVVVVYDDDDGDTAVTVTLSAVVAWPAFLRIIDDRSCSFRGPY